MDILAFIGKFHPLVVHFPIALLLSAWAIAAWHRLRSSKGGQETVSTMIYLGTVGAVLAVVCGLLLAKDGGYGEELLANHALGAYLTMGGALVSAWLCRQKSRYMMLALSMTCLLVSITAHWGATITHGQDYFSIAKDNSGAAIGYDAFLASVQAADSLSERQLMELSIHARTIMANNCYSCHNEVKHKGALKLDSEEGLLAGGESGKDLLTGSQHTSELVRRLRLPRSDEEAMPQEGEFLEESAIELLATWIDHGAHWADTTIQMFYSAPHALTKPSLPASDHDHPIDRLVDDYFQQQRDRWPKTISDRTYIKRAYLDVIGLLPSFAEVQEFEQSEDPQKRSKLIDSLLARDEDVAIHWMSFWNDLLRNDYTGTGFITGGRKQITGWLFQALVDNKPYDEMVSELVNPSEESEGFIKGIQWRGAVNSSQSTEMQAAQNVSQAFLGTNLKCASCHNSFVNNLTLEQAYGFANIFADSSLELHQCDKPIGVYTKPAFLYPEIGDIVGDSTVDRLASLVQLITARENGRFYRTFVNRIWAQLFGRGIIGVVDDMDAMPWSQDVLDWLAANFADEGTDIRALLRLILTSKAYQLEPNTKELADSGSDKNYVFRGPHPRRLKAEQTIDVLSQVLTPFYHGVAFSADQDTIDPRWIWHRQVEFDRTVLPYPGERFLRKSFEVCIDSMVAAEYLVTADHSFDLYLDGEKIAAGSSWQDVQSGQLTSLQKGSSHQLAARVTNDGDIPNPAGLLFCLRIKGKNGEVQYVNSDNTWVSSDSVGEANWMEMDFAGEGWSKAHTYGKLRSSHWGRPLEFSFSRSSTGSHDFARAALVQVDPLMKALGRPVRENLSTSRDNDATLLQALTLTNGDLIHQRLHEAAEQWLHDDGNDPEQLVHRLYTQLLLRSPSRSERRYLTRSWQEVVEADELADAIWSMTMSPEFQFL